MVTVRRPWAVLLRSEERLLAVAEPDSFGLLCSRAYGNPTRLRKGVGDYLKFLAVETNVLAGTVPQSLYIFDDFRN